MFCSKCGTQFEDEGAKFCTGCGNTLNALESPPANPSEASSTPSSTEAYQPPKQAPANSINVHNIFVNFIKDPVGVIKNSEIQLLDGVLLAAFVPLTLIIMAYAAIPYSGEFLSFGTLLLHTVLHSAVWLLLLTVVPILVLKLANQNTQINFPLAFARISLVAVPIVVLNLLTAIVGAIGFSYGLVIYFAGVGVVGVLVLAAVHTVMVQKIFNVEKDKAIYASLITVFVATIYQAFAFGWTFQALADNLFGGFGAPGLDLFW